MDRLKRSGIWWHGNIRAYASEIRYRYHEWIIIQYLNIEIFRPSTLHRNSSTSSPIGLRRRAVALFSRIIKLANTWILKTIQTLRVPQVRVDDSMNNRVAGWVWLACTSTCCTRVSYSKKVKQMYTLPRHWSWLNGVDNIVVNRWCREDDLSLEFELRLCNVARANRPDTDQCSAAPLDVVQTNLHLHGHHSQLSLFLFRLLLGQ